MIGILNFNYKYHKDILLKFSNLAETGKVLQGDSKGHKDGWGIGFYQSNKAMVYKSAKSILQEKKYFIKLLKNIDKSPILIVHLRKSSWKNTTSKEHSQPFNHKKWIFAHNGTIYDYKKLININIYNIHKNNLFDKPTNYNHNPLDSEIYFHFFIKHLNKNPIKSFKNIINYIKNHNRYSSLTCLFSDGKSLFAFREYSKSPSYYTLFYTNLNNSKIVCSEKIHPELFWKPIKKSKLTIFKY